MCAWNVRVFSQHCQRSEQWAVGFPVFFLTCAKMPKQGKVTPKLMQRCIIWWLWKHDKTARDIWLDLTAVFLEQTYSLDAVRFWVKEYENGRDKIEDLDHSGRPKTARCEENVEAVMEGVASDRRQTVSQLSFHLQISHASVHRILKKDLKLRKKTAKYVPKLLTAAHKATRIESCRDILQWRRDERHLLEKVVTGDESYFHLYMPETKEGSRQWLEAGAPRPQKALRGRGGPRTKVMLLIFFDCHGVVFRKFYRNQTMTKELYLIALQDLFEAIQNRRTQLWRRGNIILHDDNASPHRADIVENWKRRHAIWSLPHPPYSPDLAPADFWLFGRLKKVMRGIRYPDQNVLEFETDRMLGLIPQHEFREAILRKWPHRMRRCLGQEGGYFEGLPVANQ